MATLPSGERSSKSCEEEPDFAHPATTTTPIGTSQRIHLAVVIVRLSLIGDVERTFRGGGSFYKRQLLISVSRMAVAPSCSSCSMIWITSPRFTIARTAHQPFCSRRLTVGEL